MPAVGLRRSTRNPNAFSRASDQSAMRDSPAASIVPDSIATISRSDSTTAGCVAWAAASKARSVSAARAADAAASNRVAATPRKGVQVMV